MLPDRPDTTVAHDVYAGQIVVVAAPGVLVAPALGSCVGVALWDALDRRAGLAHVMLPTSGSRTLAGDVARFADLAVPMLLEQMLRAGSPRRRLVAKLAGGAAMFKGESILATIGTRNVAEVRRVLTEAGVRIVAEDTGGSHARTVELHAETGRVVIRSYTFGVHEI